MMNKFDELQKLVKDNMDLSMESLGTVSKGMQAIAAEVADYQKKSFDEGTAVAEKVVASQSIEKAFEAQSDYFKTAYEGFVGELTKIGEMYSDMSKGLIKPYEAMLGTIGK
ncbi:phasin family protein [Roseibium algae]|uniref:Phasin family protein n=1 Tax=Roseibium algae TaxID=3123038 RepID=A0ABU8TRD4_9HYPH